MQKSTHLNRRLFLCSQLAFASTMGLGGTAFAYDGTTSTFDDVASGVEEQANWATGTASQFEKLINQQFTAKTQDGNLLHMTLVEATAGNSDPNRPKHLERSEAVSLIFKADFAEELMAQGHHSVWVWNATLGETELFLGAIPKRSGGYEIEAILN